MTHQPSRPTTDNTPSRTPVSRRDAHEALPGLRFVAQEWLWSLLLYLASSTLCLFATGRLEVSIAFGAAFTVMLVCFAGQSRSVRVYLPLVGRRTDSSPVFFPTISWQLPLPVAALLLALVFLPQYRLRHGSGTPVTELYTPQPTYTPAATYAASITLTPSPSSTVRLPATGGDFVVCRLEKGVPAIVVSEIGVRLRTDPFRDPTNSNVVTMLSPRQQLTILSDQPTYNSGTGWWYVKVADVSDGHQEIGWTAEFEPGSTVSQLIQPYCQ